MKNDKLFLCLLAAASAAFLALCFNSNVWYDEAYSLAMIQHGFGEIASITAADVHPPLYYWALKIFMLPFGENLLAAKVFSVIPMCLTMVSGYTFFKREENKQAGLLFCAIFALMPVYTIYAVQVRMYSWCVFFVFTCGIQAYSAYTENKLSNWIGFAVCGICAAYTHYFALVSAGIIYGFLLIASLKKGLWKRWVLFALITAAAYVPWLTSFVAQLADKVENEYWIAPITGEVIGGYFKTWYKCGSVWWLYLAGSLLLYAAAAAGLIFGERKLRIAALLGAAVFVLTNIVGIAASAAVRPVFIERYAIPALPFLAAVAALGISRLNRKAVCAAAAVFAIGGFVLNYPVDFKFEYGETDAETGEYINSNGFDALICYVDSQLYGVLSYYAPDLPVYRPKTSKGSPFDNIYPLAQFDREQSRKAALFVPDGDPVPAEATQGYTDIYYDRDVITYGQKSNVYIMKRSE